MIEKKPDEPWSVSKPEYVTWGFWDSLTNDGKLLVCEAAAQFELNTAATRDYGNQPAGELNQRTSATGKLMSGSEHPELAALRATERRNRIAEGFAFALVSHAGVVDMYLMSDLARDALELADALIAELDK